MKSFFKSIIKKIKHKLHHFELSELKKSFIKGGIPLLVIIIMWEIIEDILFPIVFGILGTTVHPAFYAGIPIAWTLCLHWVMVPLLWTIWLKLKNKSLDER